MSPKDIQINIFNLVKELYKLGYKNIESKKLSIIESMGLEESFKVEQFPYNGSDISFTTSKDSGIYNVTTKLKEIDWADVLSEMKYLFRKEKIKKILSY